MQIAALADIHGNVHALNAVLADPRLAATGRILVLGDVVAGTFPAETLDLLLELGGRARCLRGNADRMVLEDDGEESAWVRERLGAERLAEVAAWPGSFAAEIDGLGAVRCCHAAPDDDEAILTRDTPAERVARTLGDTEERVVIGGHTHVQFDRAAGPYRYVNAGSVGRPCEARPGAYWALLGPDVELVRTHYDVQEAAAAVLASGQPSAHRVAAQLVDPPPPEEWTAQWEALRSSRTPRLP